LNYKWKKAANTRENLDLFTAVVLGKSDNERIYYQQFKTNDGQPTGVDSAQRQINDNSNGVFELRANYNKPITKKILLSGDVSVHGSINNNNLVTAIQPKGQDAYITIDSLSPDFRFLQNIYTARLGFTLDLPRLWRIIPGVQ